MAIDLSRLILNSDTVNSFDDTIPTESREGVQIDGRNLIPESKDIRMRTNNNTTHPLEVTQESDGSWKMLPSDGVGISTYFPMLIGSFYDADSNHNGRDYHVLSVEVMSPVEREVYFTGQDSYTLPPNKWVKIERHYPNGVTNANRLAGLRSDNTHSPSQPLYYRNHQFELGTKATDRAPAPEDFENLRGIRYFLFEPLRPNVEYTLTLTKSITQGAFLGVWVGNYFAGYVQRNSLTFKVPASGINNLILKTSDELGTINSAVLTGLGSYTHEQVANVLHMQQGSRQVRFRYFLLDQNENQLAELQTVESASIEQSAFSDIKRTAKFKLKDTTYQVDGEQTEINWYSDRIQVFIEFKMPDGFWIDYSLGIFLISSPTKNEQGESIYRDVEAYDKLLILNEDKVTDRHTIFAGVRYYDAMIQILQSAGVNTINIENNNKVLSNDKEWEPGTKKLQILNDLASDLNFTPFWVDEFGYFRSSQYRSPQESPTDYIYEDNELSVTLEGMEEELDLFDLPNVFMVVVANPDTEEEFTSMFENTNPNHPRSIPRLGRRVVRFEEKDDIADQESLDGYVERLASEASQVYGRVKFKTAIMPFHSYSNVLRIRNKLLGLDHKYAETNWSMNLEPGADMQHEVRRVVSLV